MSENNSKKRKVEEMSKSVEDTSSDNIRITTKTDGNTTIATIHDDTITNNAVNEDNNDNALEEQKTPGSGQKWVVVKCDSTTFRALESTLSIAQFFKSQFERWNDSCKLTENGEKFIELDTDAELFRKILLVLRGQATSISEDLLPLIDYFQIPRDINSCVEFPDLSIYKRGFLNGGEFYHSETFMKFKGTAVCSLRKTKVPGEYNFRVESSEPQQFGKESYRPMVYKFRCIMYGNEVDKHAVFKALLDKIQ